MKTVLIIDDKASELKRAELAARKLGFKPIPCDPKKILKDDCYLEWMERIKKADYVVTDLMWSYHEGRDEKPMGLLVVIHAKHLGKPVAICTNCGDHAGGHHGEAIGFIHDGYITTAYHALGRTRAFVWDEYKNWERAIRLVAGLPDIPEEDDDTWLSGVKIAT